MHAPHRSVHVHRSSIAALPTLRSDQSDITQPPLPPEAGIPPTDDRSSSTATASAPPGPKEPARGHTCLPSQGNRMRCTPGPTNKSANTLPERCLQERAGVPPTTPLTIAACGAPSAGETPNAHNKHMPVATANHRTLAGSPHGRVATPKNISRRPGASRGINKRTKVCLG